MPRAWFVPDDKPPERLPERIAGDDLEKIGASELVDGDEPLSRGPALHQRVTIATEYQGPLPDSAMLREYEDILPGAAERIVSQWERETEFRHEVVRAAAKTDHESMVKAHEGMKRGQWLGFASFFLIACVAIAALVMESPVVGGLGLVLAVGGQIIWALRRDTGGSPDPPADDINELADGEQ